MALLRFSDIIKMSKLERESKLKDLRLELVKANVTANKTSSKTKEIKRAISRLITLNKSTEKEELSKK